MHSSWCFGDQRQFISFYNYLRPFIIKPKHGKRKQQAENYNRNELDIKVEKSVNFSDPIYKKINVNWYSPSIYNIYFDDNYSINNDNNSINDIINVMRCVHIRSMVGPPRGIVPHDFQASSGFCPLKDVSRWERCPWCLISNQGPRLLTDVG